MGRKKNKIIGLNRPTNPYLEFCSEERLKLANDLRSLPLADVGRELGRRWKELEPEQKRKYQERSRLKSALYANERKKTRLS